MGWKTVHIKANQHLKVYLSNLEIISDNNRILIPLCDIDTLIVESYTATYTNKLLVALANFNINCIFCDADHLPFMHLVSIKGHHNSLKIVEQQIAWNLSYRMNLWQHIVKNKIINQKLILQHLKITDDLELLDQYLNEMEGMDRNNCEAHAARHYWKQLFGNKFIRDYDGEMFPFINSGLNYGYTILRSMVTRTIVKKGLDPRISIFHRSFQNFFALASDLMEVFRPLVDLFVYQANQKQLAWYQFKEQILEHLANAQVIISEKKYYLNSGIDVFVEKLQNGQMLQWVDLCV